MNQDNKLKDIGESIAYQISNFSPSQQCVIIEQLNNTLFQLQKEKIKRQKEWLHELSKEVPEVELTKQ